ncbi:MAG: ABC transporter substrate-binding protein [Alphaproteobacteria bacterium]|nr:ABC transporter substrate-binding protein [Alphaproteobacteria bacterium]
MAIDSIIGRRGLLVGTAAVALGGVVAPRRVLAQGAALRPVSFRLNYVANAEHAPYYLGVKKGFYREEGIDLRITPGIGSNDTVRLVGAGNEMFGVAVSDSVATGRGRGVPVTSLAVLLQQSPNVLVSLEQTNIRTPQDLYGKHVGVSSRSTVFAFWKAFVRAANLDESRIRFTDLGATASTGVLIARTIDATITLATNEVVAMRNNGIKLNIIDLGAHGVHAYGQVLFGNQRIVETDRDLAARMRRATLRSWEYTIGNVPEAIAALKEAVPATDVKTEIDKWTEIIPRTRPLGGGSVPFGSQTVEGWQRTLQTFNAANLIERQFQPSEIIANLG